MRLFSFVLILLFSFSAFGQLTKADQKRALDTYLAEQKVSNGGINVKNEFFDIKITKLRTKYRKLISEAMTLEELYGYWPKTVRKVLPEEEFEQLMIGLTAEFQDGHHNTMRKSSKQWDLGLKTAVIQGKLYITGTNDKVYTKGRFGVPLNVGDEIISLNGQSVHELKKEFLLYTRMFGGTYESQEAMALESMVNRSGRYLRPVKEGSSVVLEIKRGQHVLSGELNWVDISKLYSEVAFYSGMNPNAPKGFKAPRYHYGMMSQRMSHFRQGVDSIGFGNGAVTEIGDNVNLKMVRELSKIPIEHHQNLTVAPVERLQAYTVQMQGAKAGVIRIPSYSPNGYIEVMREFNWIAEVIDQMNNSGVTYFVIDANSNGGGYVNYVSHLMRFFAFAGDIETGSANIKLTKTYLQMLKQSSIDGIGVEFLADFGKSGAAELTSIVPLAEVPKTAAVNLKDYFNIVKENFADKNQLRVLYERLQKKYEAGERWSGQLPYMGTTNGITENTSGRSSRLGNPIFKKPVIFLNDIRSASGGDYAPAILLANQRAVVMGDTSRGLGMPVFRGQESLPGSEMSTRNPYAFSLLPNGLPLENIGAVPHLRREVFHYDLLNGFKNYAVDVLQAGILLSQKKELGDIRKALNASVVDSLAGKGKLPESIMEIQKLSNELRENVNEIVPKNKTEALAKKYQKLYSDFNFMLEIVKEEGLSTYGVLVGVPLPEFLLQEDIILASNLRSRSVVNRLKELSTHSRYAKRPEVLRLFKVLVKTFNTIENVSTYNDCNTLFKALKSFKTK